MQIASIDSSSVRQLVPDRMLPSAFKNANRIVKKVQLGKKLPKQNTVSPLGQSQAQRAVLMSTKISLSISDSITKILEKNARDIPKAWEEVKKLLELDNTLDIPEGNDVEKLETMLALLYSTLKEEMKHTDAIKNISTLYDNFRTAAKVVKGQILQDQKQNDKMSACKIQSTLRIIDKQFGETIKNFNERVEKDEIPGQPITYTPLSLRGAQTKKTLK